MAMPFLEGERVTPAVCESCHEPITSNNPGWRLAANSKGSSSYIHDGCYSVEIADRQTEAPVAPQIQHLGLHDTTVHYALHCNFETYTEMLEALVTMLVHEKTLLKDRQTWCIKHNGSNSCVLNA